MNGRFTLGLRHIVRLIRRCLAEGKAIELEGIGVVRLAAGGQCELEPDSRPRVFIAYAVEDAKKAEPLYDELESAGMAPWMDRRSLLAGQDWPRAISQAIEVSDYFVACFSRRSIGKRGSFQWELRYALECAQTAPLDDTYVIPFRLDDCRPPREFSKHSHWVDGFPDYPAGVRRLVRMIQQQERLRGKRRLELVS